MNEAAPASAPTEAAPAAAAPKSKREVEEVLMSDGRKVEFVGKAKVLKTGLIGDRPVEELSSDELKNAHIGHAAIRMDFRNGTTRTYPLNHEIALRYALHGALQKYGDQLAGEDAPDLDDWAASTDSLHEQLKNGDWSKARVGGSMAGTSVLIQALVEYTGRTLDEVKAHIADWTPQQKQQLRIDPEIKAIVDRIEQEKAAKATKVDVGALKASLKGLAA